VRQQILRLLVKEVLVGNDTITLRHSIPIPQSGPRSNGSPAPSSGDGGSLPGPGYLLRSGNPLPFAGKSSVGRSRPGAGTPRPSLLPLR
jgi:site-specific DNA recombinase